MQDSNPKLPSKRTETLTRRLRLSLEKGDKTYLVKVRGTVTMQSILEGKEPIFMDIRKMVPLEELVKPVAMITQDFIERSGLKPEGSVAASFAAAIVEREPTWTLMDVVKFFDHVMYSQHNEKFRIVGNTITTFKLLEFVPYYEEDKAIVREQLLNEKKNDTITKRESTKTDVKSLMGKALEEVYIRREKGEIVYDPPPIPDEKFFNKITTPVTDNSAGDQ